MTAARGLSRLLPDTLVMAERNLVRLPRAPDLLLGFTVQPIMFVLLFAYVFGGAIRTPGYDSYIDFLIPGIIAQNIAFGGFATALGLAEDMTKGLIDRFRSLPTTRASVLAGRTLADLVTNLLSLGILLATGLIIGFTLIFPITFISSAFVPVESMPAGLEQVAAANPVSVVVDAMRALWLGAPAGNHVWLAVVWCVALIAVFAPLAVAKYRRAASG
jgi:ABC-2 type transport system permease protein/oleandomycin transport system permease protein